MKIKDSIKKKYPKFSKIIGMIVHPISYYTIFVTKWKEKKQISEAVNLQKTALMKLKNKNFLNCLFLVSDIADWKCDRVFQLMNQHSRFNPFILICPAVNYGKEQMGQKRVECVNFFKRKGYNYAVALNEKKYKSLDIKKIYAPDIIFYTCPYVGITEDCYYITNYSEILSVYIPYSFSNNNDLSYQYDLLFHNLVWRYYVESNEHKKYSIKTSRNKGRNVVVTGYPAIEDLIDNRDVLDNVWKIKNKKFKRIIWAPHHTIESAGNVFYSCFLEYADFMIEMAKKYSDSIQIAFKPHPLLRKRLEILWGQNKTNSYYKLWENMNNTIYVEGEYTNLFVTSDAMIHDSGSFLIEYLYVNKPVMRTLNDIPLEKMYNSFALKCLKQYYFARNKTDIEIFIQNVINGIDDLKGQRTAFLHDILKPKSSPSREIINDIINSIDNQILYRC